MDGVTQVVPGLYRGPRPQSQAALASLRSDLGVNTILDLQSDAEIADVYDETEWAKALNMAFNHQPWSLVFPPSAAQIANALAVVRNQNTAKAVYVHCFPPDTIVGALVPSRIDSAEIPEVIGHDGRTHRVSDLHKRPYCGDLTVLNACGILPVRCTSEHPFLVVQPYRSPNGQAVKPIWYKNRGKGRGFLDRWFSEQPRWLRADQIRTGDCLVTPIPRLPDSDVSCSWVAAHKGRKSPPDQRVLPVDDDLAWLFGLYIADGSTNGINGINFVLSPKDDLARLMRTLTRFGILPKSRDYDKYVRVMASSRSLAAFFSSQFGCCSSQKHIPAWLMNQRTSKSLLEGITDGDGYRYGNHQILSSTSIALIHQVRQLLLSLGEYPHFGLHKRSERNPGYPNASPMYDLRWTRSGQHRTYWWNDLYCHPVQSITTEPFDGNVFNLEVQDVHSYLAGGIVAHNCHDGVDRTGVFCAAYRVLEQGWTFGKAVGEMIDYGCHLTPYCLWLEPAEKAINTLKA